MKVGGVSTLLLTFLLLSFLSSALSWVVFNYVVNPYAFIPRTENNYDILDCFAFTLEENPPKGCSKEGLAILVQAKSLIKPEDIFIELYTVDRRRVTILRLGSSCSPRMALCVQCPRVIIPGKPVIIRVLLPKGRSIPYYISAYGSGKLVAVKGA